MISLPLLKKNQVGRVVAFRRGRFSTAALRFMEMGIVKNSKVQLIQKLSFKGILILLTEHGKYSVRAEDCRFIQVEVLPTESL